MAHLVPILLAAALLMACGGRPSPDDHDSGDSGAPESGDISSDSKVPDDGAASPITCGPTVGLSAPLTACSATSPCTDLGAGVEAAVESAPMTPPTCTTSNPKRASFDDGPPDVTIQPDGTRRPFCAYRPTGASSSEPRPLVIWLHGAFGSADDIYNGTSLREKAETFDLAGDPTRPGFVLVSVQGRNLHWPTADARDGSHHDIFHRDLSAPSGNPDIALLDQLIDDLVSSGGIDPSAIYLMGWSNGGFFAQLYGLARHEHATPNGNRVAAVAVYTAADPFHEAILGETPSCRLSPYPTSRLPLFLISRACDIIACSEAQAARFRDQGHAVAPGAIVDSWVSDLATRVGTTIVARRIIDGTGKTKNKCAAPGLCLYALALVNHIRWPDGVGDKGGIDHEPAMLEFLRAHRLSLH